MTTTVIAAALRDELAEITNSGREAKEWEFLALGRHMETDEEQQIFVEYMLTTKTNLFADEDMARELLEENEALHHLLLDAWRLPILAARPPEQPKHKKRFAHPRAPSSNNKRYLRHAD